MGDSMNKEQELYSLRNAQKETFQAKILKDSMIRLKDLSTKKFKTCFVYAIAEFENVFGLELWGHNLPENQLTVLQKANRNRWQQVRTNILNKGNTQSRAMVAEMALHEIKFVGYKMDLTGGKEHG